MAANDEFPRGLPLNAPSTVGATASVTFPATPGIAWVLTDVLAYIGATGGASGANGLPAVQITIGATTYTIGTVGPPPSGTTDNVSWSGKLLAPVDTAITVGWSESGANTYEQITAEAYPE